MHITILTLFPNMIQGFISESIIKRAQAQKKVTIDIIDIRDFAVDSYKTVDGKPYGGGIGMIMRVDVIYHALQKVKKDTSRILLTSARGNVYTQQKAVELTSSHKDIIIIAGHYEGVDERISHFIDEEISIGDYILTGGELPACIIADSIVRLIPGVLKHKEATEIESFSLSSKKILLEYPQYTRPEQFMGYTVPSILLSGDHAKIDAWKKKQAMKITAKRRPDLLK